MKTLAGAFGKSERYLNDKPEAASIQPAASQFLAMLNELTEYLGDKRYTVFWLKTPQPEFGGKTPLDYLRAGRLDLVVGLANDIIKIVPD